MGSTRLKSFIKMELLQKNVLKLRKLWLIKIKHCKSPNDGFRY
jgi:hypothetical protein